MLFSKALEGVDVKGLITNVGAGAGSGSGAAAAPAAAAAAPAAEKKEAKKEEKKVEEKKEESDGDMGFGSFCFMSDFNHQVSSVKKFSRSSN